MALLWLILKRDTILDDFFLLDRARYRYDVMTTLKLWLVQYGYPDVRLISQIDSPCVSFTIYQQCHDDIDGDVTPTLLQYQNVYWVYKIVSKQRNSTSNILNSATLLLVISNIAGKKLRKVYWNVIKLTPDVYYPFNKIRFWGRPEDIMS